MVEAEVAESNELNQFKYDGFISYSHVDRKLAGRIQRYLESHQLPGSRRKLRLFRDNTDIRSGTLGVELQQALAQSRCLILCCSTAAQNSHWVQQEIETFQSGPGDRPIIIILLSGEVADSIPSNLLLAEQRYSDVRNGWVMGFMRPAAHIELIRALAVIADLDLRQLISWDARRRRRNAVIATSIIAALAVTVILFPFQHTREPSLGEITASLRTLEYCDLVGPDLILTTRERTSGRANEVALYKFPGGVKTDEWVWLEESDYTPTRQLVHIGALDNVSRNQIEMPIDWEEVRRQKQGIFAGLADYYDLNLEEIEDAELPGYWLAQPVPDFLIIVYGLAALEVGDPLDADILPPTAAQSIVVVVVGGEIVSTSVVERLLPPSPNFATLSRSTANFNNGLPVAILNNEIWIGMPVREDGGLGGLWRSPDLGVSWSEQDVSGSVASLLADPGRQQLYLATAAGQWDAGVRSGEYNASLRQSSPLVGQASVTWQNFSGPPYASNSDIQLCGIYADGTLLTRIDTSIFATGPYNIMRVLLDD